MFEKFVVMLLFVEQCLHSASALASIENISPGAKRIRRSHGAVKNSKSVDGATEVQRENGDSMNDETFKSIKPKQQMFWTRQLLKSS